MSVLYGHVYELNRGVASNDEQTEARAQEGIREQTRERHSDMSRWDASSSGSLAASAAASPPPPPRKSSAGAVSGTTPRAGAHVPAHQQHQQHQQHSQLRRYQLSDGPVPSSSQAAYPPLGAAPNMGNVMDATQQASFSSAGSLPASASLGASAVPQAASSSGPGPSAASYSAARARRPNLTIAPTAQPGPSAAASSPTVSTSYAAGYQQQQPRSARSSEASGSVYTPTNPATRDARARELMGASPQSLREHQHGPSAGPQQPQQHQHQSPRGTQSPNGGLPAASSLAEELDAGLAGLSGGSSHAPAASEHQRQRPASPLRTRGDAASASESSSSSSAGAQQRPLADLIESESAYVEDLSNVIRRVAAAWSRSNLPPPELDQVFRAVEAVFRISRTFLGRLNEIGPSPASPHALGDLLMGWVPELEPAYTRYARAHHSGFDLWPPVQDNARLHDILASLPPPRPADGDSRESAAGSRRANATLDSLFALPRRRLVYYHGLYHRLLASSQAGRPEHAKLTGSIQTLEALIGECDAAAARRVGGGGDAQRSPDRDQLPSPPPAPPQREPPQAFAPPPPQREQQQLPPPPPPQREMQPPPPPREMQPPQREMLPPQREMQPPPRTASAPAPSPVRLRIEDLEGLLNTERVLDIFTMQPKACRLQISPPNLGFTREIKRAADAVVSLVPSSDPQRREFRLSRAFVILLTDLLLVCEHMEQPGKQAFWLVYPPLAARHLRVTFDGLKRNDLDVAIMRRERLRLTFDNEREKWAWVQALDDAINVASGNAPMPRSPTSQPSPLGSQPPPAPWQQQQQRNGGPDLRTSSSTPDLRGQYRRPSGPMAPPVPPLPQLATRDYQQQQRHGSADPAMPLSAPARGVAGPPMMPPLPSLPMPAPGFAQHPRDRSPSGSSAGGRRPSGRSPSPYADSGPPSAGASDYAGSQSFAPYQQQQQQQHLAAPGYAQDFGMVRSRSAEGLRAKTVGGPGQGAGARDPAFEQYSRSYQPPSVALRSGKSRSGPESSALRSGMGDYVDESELLSPPGGAHDGLSASTSGGSQISLSSSREAVSVTAQMRCKVFAQQKGHAQWKALGTARLKLYVRSPSGIKQLVVDSDKGAGSSLLSGMSGGNGGKTMISTIVRPDGVERVGKTGVAIELADAEGERSGIVNMLQLKTAEAASGLFTELLQGSDRQR